MAQRGSFIHLVSHSQKKAEPVINIGLPIVDWLLHRRATLEQCSGVYRDLWRISRLPIHCFPSWPSPQTHPGLLKVPPSLWTS